MTHRQADAIAECSFGALPAFFELGIIVAAAEAGCAVGRAPEGRRLLILQAAVVAL